MSRYIDADLLKENHLMSDDCNNCEQNPIACEYDYEYTKKDFCEWIDNEPTANVRENVYGEWLKGTHKGTHFVDSVCSNCGKAYSLYPLNYNFCPDCGADMRKRQKNDMGRIFR